MRPRSLLIMTILIFAASCQTTFDPPPQAETPSVTPAAFVSIPTQTPRLITVPTLPSPIPSTRMPTLPPPTTAPTALLLVTAEASQTALPPTEAPVTLTATPDPALIVRFESLTTVTPITEVVGTSVEGRDITAYRFGTGRNVLMLIGGMHGGWEANTVSLMDALIAHFSTPDGQIPNDAALVIIPAANPDGLIRGRTAEGRFNANGVDLNRNWSCDWRPEAVWRDRPVNPGAQPLSEPETLALAGYILRERPAAVLFYHSAANGIFAGTCGGDQGSASLAQIYGQAVGYSYGRAFTAYPVTGTAPAWANGQGIPAADVELPDSDNNHFSTHLRGVEALLRLLGS